MDASCMPICNQIPKRFVHLLDLTIVGGLQQLLNAASAERVAAHEDSRLAFWRRGLHRVIFVTNRALVRTSHGRHGAAV